MFGFLDAAELVIDHDGAVAAHHHTVRAPDRGASLFPASPADRSVVRNDDLVFVAHDVPRAVEPRGCKRLSELSGNCIPQCPCLVGRKVAIRNGMVDVGLDLLA